MLAGCSDGGTGSGAATGVEDDARRRRDMATPPDLADNGDLATATSDLATAPDADMSGGGTIQCVVRPQQTEGPYFVDEHLLRSDVRSDPSNGTVSMGAALQLTFSVARLSGTSCTPLALW